MTKGCRAFCFAWTRRNLNEVLIDHALASFGDSNTNFVYSLAISNRKGSFLGTKVKGSVLAEARMLGLKKLCLRNVETQLG